MIQKFVCFSLLLVSFTALAKEIKITILSELPGVDLDSPAYLLDIPQACKIAVSDKSSLLAKAGIVLQLDFKLIKTDSLAPYVALKEAYSSDSLGAVGFQSSDQVATASKVIDGTDFLAISPYASATKILDLKPNYLSLVANNREVAKVVQNYIETTLKSKKIIAIVAWDSPYSKDFYESLDAKFKERVKLYKVWDNLSQFEFELKSIKAEAPDLVLLPNFPVNSASIIKMLSTAGIKTVFIGPDSWGENSDNRFLKILDGTKFKGYTIRQFSKLYMSKDQLEFQKKLNNYKSNYSVAAGLYHDATSYLINLIIENRRTLNRAAILNASRKSKTIEGVMGLNCISNEKCKGRKFILLDVNQNGFSFNRILK